MKKLFISLVLLMVGVMAAQATVKVGGALPNSSTGKFTVSSGTAVLSGSTLTLTNAVINAGSNPGIQSDVDGLTIVIVGTCKITGTNRGLYLTNNTTLRTSTDGTLSIDNSTQSVYGGIKVENGATLLVEWLHLNITAQTFGISGTDYETLKLLCCEVNIELTSPGSSHSCIYGFSSLSTNANYWANGESYNTSKKELYKGSTYATSCSLKPEMTIANYIVNTHNSYTLNGGSDAGLSAGSIKYDNTTKTLTLDGVTYSGYNRFIDNRKVNGLKIVVKGTNTINNQSNYSIFSTLPFSIEGSSSTYSANKLTITKSYGALCLWLADGSLTSGTLTLKNLTLDISASNVPLYCAASSGQSGSLIIEKCKVSSNLTSTSTTHSPITEFSSVTLTDCCVNTAITPVFYNSSLKQFTNTSGALVQTVEIDVPTTTYNVAVCGTSVNNINYNNVLADGMTAGKISYDNSSKTLTLNGVTLTSTATDVIGIKMGIKDGIIKLSGSNTVSTSGEALYLTASGITMSGGTGIFTSTAKDGLSTDAGSGITLNGGSITFEGKRYGLYGGGGSSEKMTLKNNGNNGIYYFKGETKTINNLPNLELDGIDFWYNGGSKQTPGCYWDGDAGKKTVCQNGGTAVKDWVAFAYVEKYYGLTIGDVEITDCNAGAVGSKDITAGTVSYNNSSKTLTLDGAKISTTNSTSFPSCIFNTKDYSYVKGDGVDGLTIYVKSNSELTSNSWSAVNLWQNTTIEANGNASLTLSGSMGNIYATRNANVTLNNANINASGGIYASSSSNSNLYVNLTTSDRRITAKNGVYDWSTIYLQNDTKILEPTGAKLNNTYTAIVTSIGSTTAKNVVLGDKDATGIDGIEADPNAEITGIFDAQGRELQELQPGVNIVRMSDGTTRKIIKK